METIWKEDEIEAYRFICDCGDQHHCLDLEVHRYGSWNESGRLEFTFATKYLPNYDTFRGRLWRMWQILLCREIYDHDMCLRPEDREDLWKVLRPENYCIADAGSSKGKE